MMYEANPSMIHFYIVNIICCVQCICVHVMMKFAVVFACTYSYCITFHVVIFSISSLNSPILNSNLHYKSLHFCAIYHCSIPRSCSVSTMKDTVVIQVSLKIICFYWINYWLYFYVWRKYYKYFCFYCFVNLCCKILQIHYLIEIKCLSENC